MNSLLFSPHAYKGIYFIPIIAALLTIQVIVPNF